MDIFAILNSNLFLSSVNFSFIPWACSICFLLDTVHICSQYRHVQIKCKLTDVHVLLRPDRTAIKQTQLLYGLE